MQSSGSAMKENSRYMESLQAKTTLFKKQLSDLVLGDGGLQSFAKTVVDLGTGLLKFANSDMGKVILTTSMLLGGITLLSKGYEALSASAMATSLAIKMATVTEIAGLNGTSVAVAILKGGIDALTASVVANPLLWGVGIAGGIIAIGALIISTSESIDDLNQNIIELADNTKNLQSEFDKLSDKKNKNEGEKNRLKLLEAQIEANKILIQQEYEKASRARDRFEEESTVSGAGISSGRRVKTGKTNTWQNALGLDVEGASIGSLISAYNTLDSTKAKSLDQDNEMTAKKQELVAELAKEGLALQSNIDSGVKLTSGDQARYDAILEVIGSLNEKTNSTIADTEANEENSESMEIQRTRLQEIQDSLSTLAGISFSGLTDAFDTVRQAQADLNNGNGISIDSFEKLMGLGSEYIAIMFNQANSIDTTTDAEMSLYKAKIDQMAIDASLNQVELASNEIKENGVGAYSRLASSIQSATNAKWDLVASAIAEKNVTGEDLTALNSRIASIRSWAESAKKSVTVSTMQTRATKSNTKANKDNKNSLDELKKSYETVISYINKKIDGEIDKLKDLKTAEIDSIESRIDALNKQKDVEEEFWQAKIDALEKQNDTLERQIELEKLEEALARAKSTKVKIYREGIGFVNESDPTAVSEAQTNLNEFKRKQKYEDELAQLNKFKDDVAKNYEKQISDLENYKSAVEKKYDDQIAYFEKWKDNFKSSVDAYENEQNRLLALQLTGIDFESKNWTTRLNNLSSFVANWNKIQAQMTNSTASSSGGSSGGGSVAPSAPSGQVTGGSAIYSEKTEQIQKFMNAIFGTKVSENGIWDSATTQAVKSMQKQMGISSPNGLYNRALYMQLSKYISKLGGTDSGKYQRAMQLGGVPMYASGVASIPSDGMAIVGENPNKEVVVGSRLNNGMAIQASSGDGVINASGTRTFAGMMNSLSRISGLGQSYAKNDYNNSSSISISNLNVELKDVTDGDSFVRDLKNTLANISYQKGRL